MARRIFTARIIKGISALMFILTALSCSGGKGEPERDPGDVLIAQVGDSLLYSSDVARRIPSGLSETDSLAMFQTLVNAWLETNLLMEYAEENLTNLPEIEETVRRFRSQLIIDEYKRQMKYDLASLSEDSVKNWYDTHRNSYILDRPLVKGIFVKASAQGIDQASVLKMIASDDPAQIELFEKESIDRVAQYSYFRDEWVDWDVIAGMIPYDFNDAAAFLKSNKTFETSYNGMTYLLAISDYTLPGETMPYEYAKALISDFMLDRTAEREEKKIIKSIYDKAVKDGKLKLYSKNDEKK